MNVVPVAATIEELKIPFSALKSTTTISYKAAEVFQFLNEQFWDLDSVKWIVKYEPIQFLITFKEFAIQGCKFLIPILAIVKNETQSQLKSPTLIQKVYQVPLVAKVLKVVKAASFLTIPIALCFFCCYVKDFIKGDLNEKVDAGFLLLENTSLLIDSLSACAREMYEAGILFQSIAWTVPLSIISTVLWSFKLPLDAKGIWQTNLFIKEMDTFMDDNEDAKNIEALNWLLSKRKKELSVHFKENGKALKKAIKAIKMQSIIIDAGLATLALHTLKKRAYSKILSNKLSFVATTVGLIGFTTLFFSPIAIPGYAFLLISAGISLVNFIKDKIALKHFEENFFLSHEKP